MGKHNQPRARAAIAGGFTQANHGKADHLRRLERGDWIAFYSPRTDYPEGAPLQAFPAFGRVVDDEPCQVEMTPDFHPFRRNVEFHDCVETPIRPLIDKLEFIATSSGGATASGSGCSGFRRATSRSSVGP